jgi:prefoldin subunit 5
MDTPQAAKENQVNIQLKQIDIELGNLKSTITSLTARLASVIRTMPTPGEAEAKDKESLVPLALELRSFASTIKHATNDINAILINLEI